MPGGTTRNWDSYGSKISAITEKQKAILADPQTSGGLLIVVDEDQQEAFEKEMLLHEYSLKPFGRLLAKGPHIIEVL
jgi:selenide, water dikinase